MKTFKLMATILGVVVLLFSGYMLYITIDQYLWANNLLENYSIDTLIENLPPDIAEGMIERYEQMAIFDQSFFVFNFFLLSLAVGTIYWARK